jgi:PAS domain S-box-containing protein
MNALVKSEARCEAILNALPDMIFLLDEDGTYLDWYSAKSIDDLYAPPDQFLGKNVRDVMPPELSGVFAEKLKNVLKTDELATVEYTLTTDGESKLFETRIVKCDDHRLLCIMRDLTERKRTEEDLRRLSSRLLTLQDEERRKIAKELHDVTAQNLYAITIYLANLRQQMDQFTDGQAQMLMDCEHLCEQCLHDVRTLSYALHPPALDRLGLTPSVAWYIGALNKRSGMEIKFEFPDHVDRLPLEMETDIFRIIQEGLCNIALHSTSRTAMVHFHCEAGQFVLQITDNGCGLTYKNSGGHNGNAFGIGLPSIRERLRRWGGHCHIDSEPEGVILLAHVPIPKGESRT